MDKKICGIHRVEKRTKSAVPGLQNEANRDSNHIINLPNSEIDWSRTKENRYAVESKNWTEKINYIIEKHGCKTRSNSIVMLDTIYTASPEFFKGKTKDEIEEYFYDCFEFHIDEYCHKDAELVINCVIHYDETTPHMHIASVPITEDDRLSARDICGNFKAYCKRQDHFYEKVCKGYGLDRGDPKSETLAEHVEQVDHKKKKLDKEYEDKHKALDDEYSEYKKTLQDELNDLSIQNKDLAAAVTQMNKLLKDKEDEQKAKDEIIKQQDETIKQQAKIIERQSKQIKYIRGSGKVVKDVVNEGIAIGKRSEVKGGKAMRSTEGP